MLRKSGPLREFSIICLCFIKINSTVDNGIKKGDFRKTQNRRPDLSVRHRPVIIHSAYDGNRRFPCLTVSNFSWWLYFCSEIKKTKDYDSSDDCLVHNSGSIVMRISLPGCRTVSFRMPSTRPQPPAYSRNRQGQRHLLFTRRH